MVPRLPVARQCHVDSGSQFRFRFQPAPADRTLNARLQPPPSSPAGTDDGHYTTERRLHDSQ